MKKAFTLVEMLVVIGIIGILLAILIANFSGASESANATKCMSNMRSLCTAANAIAMSYGQYPLAGTCYRIGYDSEGNDVEQPMPAWISFDRSKNVVPCYGTGCPDDDMYALTNGTSGAFWKAAGANTEVYRCPTFTKNFIEKKGRQPLFSYAMNAGKSYECGFYANSSFDYQSWHPSLPLLVHCGSYYRADRMIMFADIPIRERCQYDHLAQKETCDCALEVNMKIGGRQYGNSSIKSRTEAIGFVHKDSRNRYYGHIAFADGHVERLMAPPNRGLKEDALTAHLCKGEDCAYEADGYRLVAQLEEEEEESE
jgi:prepilin-type N-terminal cleavage/methylation domain-containing protein/prepilin-type processing-associated H-X9-DG protein